MYQDVIFIASHWMLRQCWLCVLVCQFMFLHDTTWMTRYESHSQVWPVWLRYDPPSHDPWWRLLCMIVMTDNKQTDTWRNMRTSFSLLSHSFLRYSYLTPIAIGPILDDRLKEKFMKPWKCVLCIHFRVCVCVCVCTRATDHRFWARILIFG